VHYARQLFVASAVLLAASTSFAASGTYYCGPIVGGIKCDGDDYPTTRTFSDGMGGSKTYDHHNDLLYTSERDRINGGLVHTDSKGRTWRTVRDGNGSLVTVAPDGTKTVCINASGDGNIRCDVEAPRKR